LNLRFNDNHAQLVMPRKKSSQIAERNPAKPSNENQPNHPTEYGQTIQ
jgi:hypothetical protein